MKKYLISLAVLVVVSLALFASVVKAEENNDTNRPAFAEEMKVEREAFREEWVTKREELQEKIKTEREAFFNELKTAREAFKAEVKAKKEEFRSANAERKAGICRAAGNMVGQRFDVAVTNLEKFQARLEGVIEKLDADGEDTDLAVDALESSKDKLAEAKEKIDDIRDLIPENCENMTPEIFEQVKLLAREAKDLLKESKQDLHQVILAIKDIKNENDEEEDEDEDEDDSN